MISDSLGHKGFEIEKLSVFNDAKALMMDMRVIEL